MLYSELISNLMLGELKNTTLTSSDEGESFGKLKPIYRQTMVQYVNQGLNSLYSKFILSKKQVLLRMNPPIVTYYLRKQFARTDGTQVPYKYIDDTPLEPFQGDVVSILAVYNELGQEMPMNDIDNPFSIFTVEFDALQMPNVYEGNYYAVVYQARHPKIVLSEQAQHIHLPEFLMEALQCFVASKALSHMNGQEQTAKGQEYMAQYQMILAEVEAKDLVSTSLINNHHKLHLRGFI